MEQYHASASHFLKMSYSAINYLFIHVPVTSICAYVRDPDPGEAEPYSPVHCTHLLYYSYSSPPSFGWVNTSSGNGSLNKLYRRFISSFVCVCLKLDPHSGRMLKGGGGTTLSISHTMDVCLNIDCWLCVMAFSWTRNSY